MREQHFYGHGKLLLTGEFLILDGAKALALPTTMGQTMSVKYKRSNDPKLYWKSFDADGQCWFKATYEFWKFTCIDNDSDDAKVLGEILTQARKQNVHFLRDEVDIHVETKVEFPLKWGLGSSSTLIYNIAQWAYVSPFELLQQTFGGSGYDIACAQSFGPISYQLKSSGPRWEQESFKPLFKDNLYFIYLNQKQNTRSSIARYNSLHIPAKEKLIDKVNLITESILNCIDLTEFEQLLFEHENILSAALDLPRAKELYFQDYWGAVKSLGAWGGDFVLVTSNKDEDSTRDYFKTRGFDVVLKYDELICQPEDSFNNININSLNNEKSTFSNRN